MTRAEAILLVGPKPLNKGPEQRDWYYRISKLTAPEKYLAYLKEKQNARIAQKARRTRNRSKPR